MSSLKIVAIVLLVGGIAALAYGGFTYTKDSSSTSVGPISLTVRDREHVNIPVWAGVAAVVGGVVLLFAGGSKSGMFRA